MSLTEICDAWLLANPLPSPEDGADKDARGRVLCIGGSAEVPGGILLPAVAALRAGAGKLQVATCRSAAPGMALALPEARVIGLPETGDGNIAPEAGARVGQLANRVDAVVFGPGMMDPDAAGAVAAAMLEGVEEPVGFLLDAAAICALSPGMVGRHAGRLVLTPHGGEMARLLGRRREEIEANPLGAAREAAQQYKAVVVMKGARSHIVSPQGEAWLCGRGCVGLATSGSGDTLAGAVAALMARGAPPLLAAQWGVFLHAEAGCRLAARIGPVGFLAREIPGEFPGIMRDFSDTGG